MANLLAYLAGGALVARGGAHIAPTKAVVRSFGELSLDHRRILLMEWVAEGITHISIGLLVIVVAAVEGSGGATSQLVYRVLAAALLGLAALTAATGSRTREIWFKLCPFVLTAAAALLLAASVVA